eukprot:jgi/Ulvmu1/6235/UM028_0093.1
MNPSVQRTTCIANVREISRKYKGVLLDQFGVLHDGKSANPAAVEAVNEWSRMGLKVYILSNSSRRAATALEKIDQLGFPKEWFAGAMTSGEVTHRYLRDPPDGTWEALGTKCLHFTWSRRGTIDISSLGLSVVTEPVECDFILAHGTEGLELPDGGVRPSGREDMEALMDQCAVLGGRPMVIANPDIVTVSGGDLLPMPGSLGRYYEGKGGKTHIMGKPDPIIYKLALNDMCLDVQDIFAVGDSLEHDVAGAHAHGVDCLFIGGGIHAKDLTDSSGKVVMTESTVGTFAKIGAFAECGVPRYCMDYLRW